MVSTMLYLDSLIDVKAVRKRLQLQTVPIDEVNNHCTTSLAQLEELKRPHGLSFRRWWWWWILCGPGRAGRPRALLFLHNCILCHFTF